MLLRCRRFFVTSGEEMKGLCVCVLKVCVCGCVCVGGGVRCSETSRAAPAVPHLHPLGAVSGAAPS